MQDADRYARCLGKFLDTDVARASRMARNFSSNGAGVSLALSVAFARLRAGFTADAVARVLRLLVLMVIVRTGQVQ